MTDAERELFCLVIGHRVRTQRKSKRMSQNDLASGVGSQSMISLIESGRQLPPSDVLRFLANRLQDSVLQSYAENLERNNLNEFSVSAQNEDDLMKILLSHRGRWYAAHERIASQLCHHYYDTQNFQLVSYLCKLIIHHIQHGRSLGEAYFFLGSAALNENRFEEAEKWLKKSEESYDHLGDIFRGRLCYNLGYAYTYLDIQVLALWYAAKAVHIFHSLNHFTYHGRALGLLGTIHVRLGRLEEARESLTVALDIVKRWVINWTDRGRVLVSLAEVYTLLGASDLAKQMLEEAQETVDKTDHLCLAEMNLFEAKIAASEPNHVRTFQFIDDGTKFARLANDPHSLTQLYFLRFSLSQDEHEKLVLAEQAYNVTTNTNHHILHALAAETMASLLSEKIGNGEEVTFYMQKALNSYRAYVHKNSMFTDLIDQLPVPAISRQVSETYEGNQTAASVEAHEESQVTVAVEADSGQNG